MGGTQDFWSRCPLGAKLHRFLDTVDSDEIGREQEADDEWKWREGSSNWMRFTELMSEYPRSEEFKQSLGHQQLTSWALIQEWLSAQYQPSHLSKAIRQAIESGTYVPRGSMDVHPKFPAQAQLSQSVYHYWLSELFCAEFMPSSLLWKPENAAEGLGIMDNLRRRASNYTSCQKIAHIYYVSRKQPSKAMEVKSQDHSQPRKEACPWLDRESITGERPYYLWDVLRERTVTVHELQETPKYTCVSHTWGRWRIDKMVSVEGVPRWKIPENTDFDVRGLPLALQQCCEHLTTDYIWFDLLCIPQEETEPHLTELARREISRQALIFGNAVACVAWFSYVRIGRPSKPLSIGLV